MAKITYYTHDNKKHTIEVVVDRFKVRDDYHAAVDQTALIRPSGYDILSQLYGHMMYCDPTKRLIEPLSWPWPDEHLILAKTRLKTQTHRHLAQLQWPFDSAFLQDLGGVVDQGKQALLSKDREAFASSINRYRQRLVQQGFVASDAHDLMKALSSVGEITAFKGCGAGSADVVLLMVPAAHHAQLMSRLKRYFISYQSVTSFQTPGVMVEHQIGR